LLDLQRSGQLKLSEVKFLVVDEADRMLDLGFADDLAEVNQLTIARKQTMMFSATFAPRIQALATRVMRDPQKIQIDSPQDRHSNIEQKLFWCDSPDHKRKLLDHWLRDASIDQAIVFASTQIECDALAEDLQQVGFAAVALHGALSQGLRNRRLMALRTGQVQILVATDVAARGIDVPTITHVFNYGLPMKAEDYTHRIGRTGRAGRQGLAVTMAEFRDRRKIAEIESYSQQPIKTATIEGLEPRKPVYEFRNDRNDRGDRRGYAPRGGRPGGGGGGGFRGHGKPAAYQGAPRGAGDGPRVGFGQSAGGAAKPAFGAKPAYGSKPGFGAKPAFAGDRREGGPARHHDKPRGGDRFERAGGDRFDRSGGGGGGFGDKRRGGR
jgi:superfamily II DNA/RNA helicase